MLSRTMPRAGYDVSKILSAGARGAGIRWDLKSRGRERKKNRWIDVIGEPRNWNLSDLRGLSGSFAARKFWRELKMINTREFAKWMDS